MSALALFPLQPLLDERNNADAAEAAAAARQVERQQIQPDAPASSDSLVLPLLRTERAGQMLVTATQQYALASALAEEVATWPSSSCLSIRQDNQPLININADEFLIPASAQKIFTAVGLLEHFDLDERLVTRVLSDSEPVNGVLTGDVWVQGGADPLIATSAYAASFRRQPQLFTNIETLVADLLAVPITSIRGRLLGDESRHSTVRYVDSWPDSYRTALSTGPLSALTVNDGRTSFGNSRGAVGQPAIAFVDLLSDLLLLRGVSMQATVGLGTAPSDAIELAAVQSPTMGEMVQQMLRESDNNTAEILLRELGLRVKGEGSSAAGARVVTEVIVDLLNEQQSLAGVAPAITEPPVVVDGSGLDRGNLTTCQQLTKTLDSYGRNSLLGQGLPVAARSGTLAHRYRGNAAAEVLTAKTGLLTGVNALAGFIETPSGSFTFAQLLNGVRPGTRDGFNAQDRLVGLLLEHPVDCSEAETAFDAVFDNSLDSTGASLSVPTTLPVPTTVPSTAPSTDPSVDSSTAPSADPSAAPSDDPTTAPSADPSAADPSAAGPSAVPPSTCGWFPPVEVEPAETEPTETEAIETDLTETEPAETGPAETGTER